MKIRVGRRIAWLLLLCVACAGVAIAETPPAVRSRVEIEGYPTPDVPERAAEAGYFADVVLVGDSLASGIPLYEVMPELEVMSKIGLSARGALTEKYFKVDGSDKRVLLRDALLARQPRAIYLWLGLNGVEGSASSLVLANYHLLLNHLLEALPDTVFYIVELTPVQKKAKDKHSMLTNGNVDRFNAGLRVLAQEHNVYILPINALLRTSDNVLSTKHGASDGYHIRKSGYTILVEYLRTHTVPLN
ncbi:hypothetical protein FACS1894196_4230 [Clostridia bacterium]|nr:hypothetical protein FACS1894196_4230 [Clostridia bacterium]